MGMFFNTLAKYIFTSAQRGLRFTLNTHRYSVQRAVLPSARLGGGEGEQRVVCFIAEALILTLAANLCASHRPAVTGSSSHSCAHIDWRNIRWPPSLARCALCCSPGREPCVMCLAWAARLQNSEPCGRTRNSLGLLGLIFHLFIYQEASWSLGEPFLWRGKGSISWRQR